LKLILLHALLALSYSQTPETLLDWLPSNTQTIVVVNNFQRAVEVYHSAQHQESSSSFQKRFAVAPEEVADLIVGEFLRAELIESDGTISGVAIARVGADIDEAIKMIHERRRQHRASVVVKTFGSHEGHIITQQDEDGTERISVHLIYDGRLLLADSVAAANSIVTHFDTTGASGLAKQSGFTAVWNKCSPQLGGEALTIAWYADPWLKFRGAQQASEENKAVGEEYRFAERHGLTGIVGLGGNVVFGAGGEQTVQAFAYAPQPLISSFQMATQLTGTRDLTLPVWVSKAVAEVVVFHGNMDKALEHAGLLFDDGFADGVQGTYDEVLFDLRDLLELDVKKELYPLLGPRVYLLHGAADNREWQPLVVAFEVQDAARVAEIIRILIADDPEATEIALSEESDRVWRVPGKRGGRDFVLGILKGVAVYANDLEFAKAAMRFDKSEAFLTPDQFVTLRARTVEHIDALPSILLVRKPNSEAQASIVDPLDLVFQGAQFFVASEARDVESPQWLPRRLTMLLANHELVVGFDEKDGWKFVARTGGPTTDELHVFIDSRGREVAAKVISAADGMVTLERIDGKQFTVSMDVFSQADRAFLREMTRVLANEERQDGR
jgi:hypothetical protein